MKNILITVSLVLITPIMDSCVRCNCDANDINYDYSKIDIYTLTKLPVPPNEQFKTEVTADLEFISMKKEWAGGGSALMACS